jgi:hypothetical protein
MPRPTARRGSLLGVVLSLVLSLFLGATMAACRSESGASAPRSPAPSAGADSVSLAAAPVAVQARLHRVHGRLPDARRKAVRRQVASVVERWWDAAYLGGSYPRTRFSHAFPGFTVGARARARQDERLMSNRDIGARIDSVTPQRASMRLDVLAVAGQARGVTARFVLRFSTTGPRAGTSVVRGRVFLTRRHGPWRVFGYAVTKGAEA